MFQIIVGVHQGLRHYAEVDYQYWLRQLAYSFKTHLLNEDAAKAMGEEDQGSIGILNDNE